MPTKRSAIVTGGSRGIGRAAVLKLAQDDFDVAFCYRSGTEAAEETAKALDEMGAHYYHAPCDVADWEAVQAFVKAAEGELGKIDTLVNSAGIVRDSPMVLMSHEDWNAVIDTNLTGTFNFCRSMAFGFMKRKAGVIVNLSSISGINGAAGASNYSAAKAGINGFSRALAKELAGYGIRVNVVAPGYIETDMTDRLPEKLKALAMAAIPMGRYGQVADVAELVSFLVSDRASYITGQVIQIDGGIVI